MCCDWIASLPQVGSLEDLQPSDHSLTINLSSHCIYSCGCVRAGEFGCCMCMLHAAVLCFFVPYSLSHRTLEGLKHSQSFCIENEENVWLLFKLLSNSSHTLFFFPFSNLFRLNQRWLKWNHQSRVIIFRQDLKNVSTTFFARCMLKRFLRPQHRHLCVSSVSEGWLWMLFQNVFLYESLITFT